MATGILITWTLFLSLGPFSTTFSLHLQLDLRLVVPREYHAAPSLGTWHLPECQCLPPTCVYLTSPYSSFKILFNITSSIKFFFHFLLNVPAPISAFMMPSIDLDKQVSGHIAFMCKLVYGPGGLWLCLSHLCIPSI